MAETEKQEILNEIIEQDSHDLQVNDSLFPSDNQLEIPTLDINMQATTVDIPWVCYGEQKRTFQMNGAGTLHFYTDDYRFSALWNHPEQILKHNPRNIVEPNYSLFNETPIALSFDSIYRKRWLARSMQEKGIRCFVDLNVSSKFYAINMIGVPHGWSSYCTRGYSDRLNYLEFEYEMAKSWSDGNPLTFVVYGGGNYVKRFCQQHGLVYVTPVVTMKNKAKSIEKIKESIAFFGQRLDPTELMPQLKELPTYDKLKDGQVTDHRFELEDKKVASEEE